MQPDARGLELPPIDPFSCLNRVFLRATLPPVSSSFSPYPKNTRNRDSTIGIARDHFLRDGVNVCRPIDTRVAIGKEYLPSYIKCSVCKIKAARVYRDVWIERRTTKRSKHGASVIARSNAMPGEKIRCPSPDAKCLTRCLIDRKEGLSITINITTFAVCISTFRA